MMSYNEFGKFQCSSVNVYYVGYKVKEKGKVINILT